MVRTNLQEFAGDVHVLSNLQVGSNLFANDLAANVLNVIGSIGANLFVGDGGLLSNIATTLDDIIDQGNTVSNTIIFVSGNDATSNTGIITRSNVGISISNTEPTGEYQLTVGSNIFVNTHASNVLTVVGRIGSDYFVGDGGLLSNIATTLDQIVDQGNTISNTVILESGQDSALTSNIGLVSRENVGISVSNSNPTGEFQFGVGSNLFVNTYSSNVLTVEGNVLAQKLTFGTATVTSAYNLSHVTAQGSVTDQTISLTNATTGLAVTSNATVGGNVTAETVISTANVEVGDRLKFASNVFVDDLRVADVAANLVTYDKTTGELMDSGGLFANKLAVVSVQPPSALSANTTTIAKHGTYTVTTSGLAEYSNAWNAFDGDSAVEWTSPVTYGGGEGVYSGTSNLFAGNYIQTGVSSAGEWLAIEFPYKTTLRHMKLTPPATATSYPTSANVYATNDSLTWTEVVNWSDVNPGDQQSNVQTIIVNATESFKKYAMVVTKAVGTTTSVALAKWDLFTESFSIDGGKVEMATSAVMGGETTMDQHGPHSRGEAKLKKYPEIVFEEGKFDYNVSTNTYVQAGYTVTASSTYSTYSGWKVFDGVSNVDTKSWYSGDNLYSGGTPVGTGSGSSKLDTNVDVGEYLVITLPFKIKASYAIVSPRTNGNYSPKSGKFYGYDGNSWIELSAFTNKTYTPGSFTKIDIDSTTFYEKFAIVSTEIAATTSTYTAIGELQLYGYEEDPPAGDTSVDTTFTSIMNTPQTTGANVYVDGSLGETLTNRVTGPDATGTSATYDATGKYWELNGSLESNIAVEANTFLSGDQPHAVSVWFNSSNLEANVSNTCVFSVSDQEHLNSENLDLQSNTWHNLTYAYQGEGGSRVTYLDGRKVAEDQAEDTFGDYPPFAMTGYSQGGYVVSSNSEYNTTSYPVWEAFDDSSTSSWASITSRFDGNGIATSASVFNPGSGDVNGPYVKIEMPHKLALSYFDIVPQTSTGTACPPKKINLYASNDDTNWVYLLTDEVVDVQPGVTKTVTASTQTHYKYFVLQVTEMNPGTSVSAPAQYTWTQISNLSFYGHRENDLVRLPDPTNVLKYPHIAMTGPAQRGYVVTETSAFVGTEAYKGYNAFDEKTGDSNSNFHWISHNSYDNDGNLSNTATILDVTTVPVSGSGTEVVEGEWIQVELPHKLLLSDIAMERQYTPGNDQYGQKRAPRDGALLGSNDGTSWKTIHKFTGLNATDWPANTLTKFNGTTRFGTISTSSPNYVAYKYFRLVVQKTNPDQVASSNAVHATIREIQLYGTEEASQVPIQIGGGNIDKVANFRVYDKFIGEDQALEIWDAQKDAFGRAKSSMTLHKGRLGIGTTEPEGRLAVLDEPNGLEEFPPRAMTGYKNYFEGHGEFCVSASSETNTVRVAWKAFDKFLDVSSSDHTWTNNSNPNYNGADNTYNPSVDGIILGTGAVYGEWIKLELPYKINLKYMKMNTRAPNDLSRMPEDFKVYGSNDNSNWTELISVTGRATVFETIHNVHTDSMYKYFGVVVTKISGQNNYFRILELRYFGTREQGQSVLHDGQLTLTKSLTVPRIGPALDADDTPRRDRLVVEYNTSTNPTFEGAVRDTSGRGNDGVFYGTNMNYSSTEKALVFNGTDDYARSIRLNNTGGDYIHSVSWWFKTDITTSAIGTNEEVMWHLGDAWAARICSYASFYGNRIYLAWNTYNINCATTNINQLQWNHACVTYTGGGSSLTSRKFYLNGELEPAILDNVEGTLLNLPANTLLTLGARKPTATNTIASTYFDGQISNFKLYDTALTAEEAKTLYDMGRCDEGHHMVNFSKTRVGIGLGDGEAPRGALDVREQGIFRDILFDQRSTDNNNGVSVVRYRRGGEGGNYWKNWVNASNHYYFNYNGADSGYFASSGPNTRVQNFTGQHRTFIKDVPFSEASNLEGLIVSSDQNKYIKMSGGIEAGSNAITTNESLPVVSLSTTTNDKKCFGVISTSEDPETREDTHGILTSIFEKEKGDTRVYINSVGEGAIWVSNIGGSLEAGDYITTSNVAGYGQKQDDDVLHNYTVAKITMDCDFEPATQPVQQILRSNVVETYYLGNVHHTKTVPHEFVTTVVGADDAWSNVSISPSDTTYAEWSNLEANTQNTYTLTYTQTSNVVYDVKYTKTTTANVTESDSWDKVFVDPPTVTYAEWSNLEANTQNTYTLTYTQTTTDEKTPDEWSTLESNVQSLYNKVYYQSVEEEVAATWPGAVAHTRVTDVIENELDEHGQIQWEDHPTDTEKAYKIRYLDASGAQTDSANAVHIAAFVGCTYHCG
jgi:hypothetical protein